MNEQKFNAYYHKRTIKKLSQVSDLRELQKVPEAGLEPAQPLLAKGF